MKKLMMILTTSVLGTGIFSSQAFATSIEETARKFYAAFDAADANTIHSLTSADFKFYNPFTPPMDAKGLANFGGVIKQSFTGSQHQIKQVISTSNSATIIGTFTGKYTAPFNGIPANNKDVSVDFITVLEWNSAGKISKMTAQNNSYSFMIQLGAVPDPMSQGSVAVVGGIFQAFGRGDIPGLISMLDENVQWDSHLNPIFKTRVYKGNNDVYNFFSDLKANANITKFMPVTLYQAGNKVYVPGMFEYVTLKDNKTYTVNWNMIFTIENNKLVHFSEFFDTPQLIK